MEEVKKEYLYKLLVVGDLGSNKSSLIKQYVNNLFSTKHKATIGVDFALKVVHWDPETDIRVQLWDIAGQERFGHMTRVYYKESVGAIVVCNAFKNSLESAIKWKEDIDNNKVKAFGKDIPKILVSNQTRFEENKESKICITPEELKACCIENDFLNWYEVDCAKGSEEISNGVNFLLKTILTNDLLFQQSTGQPSPFIELEVQPAEPKAETTASLFSRLFK